MGRVAVAAGAGVDADVLALLGRKAVQHAVVEIDKARQHVPPGPRVFGVIAAGKTPLGKINRNAFGTRRESLADVFRTFVDKIVIELRAGIAFQLAVERIEQRQHRRRDNRLLQRLFGHGLGLLDILRGIGLVFERPAGQARQLAMVAVGKNGEILAVTRKVFGKAGARQRVGDRIGGKARHALLAVGDDRRAGRRHAFQAVGAGRVLLLDEGGMFDLACVIILERRLQLGRTG